MRKFLRELYHSLFPDNKVIVPAVSIKDPWEFIVGIAHRNQGKKIAKEKRLAGIPTHIQLTYASCIKRKAEGEDVSFDCDETIPEEVVVCLGVSDPGWGFGTFTIIQTPDGVFLDTECSDPETVKRAFNQMIDSAITDHEKDPEKHLLYNKNTGTRCGAWCKTCHSDE